jgi:zinc-binding alcohol dehydrogenase family protein
MQIKTQLGGGATIAYVQASTIRGALRMKAVGYYKNQPIAAPDSLVALDVPAPTPGARDLLVEVAAISVNPVDTKVRIGVAPPEGQAKILGWDAVGTVRAVGPSVTLFKTGDEVFYAGSITRPGTNAELHVVDERIVGRKPHSLTRAQAAALPLTSITAWELLFDRLGVARLPREWGDKEAEPVARATAAQHGAGSLLVIGGAGGVGSILLQIARQLTGLTVIATASRPETRDWCLAQGAHHVVDHREPLPAALAAIGVPRVDYIAGLTGTAQHLPAIVEAIKPQGKFALIDDPPVLDILPFKRKSVSVHWEAMFTRAIFETDDMIAQHHLLNEVAELVDAGVLRTTLTEVLGPIDAATLKTAHARLEGGRTIGKLVMEGF